MKQVKNINKISYWKTSNDIPNNIKDFMLDRLNKLHIFNLDAEKDYCSNCLEVLDINYTCLKCGVEYSHDYPLLLVLNKKFKDTLNFAITVHFYVFDVVDSNAILYQIDALIYYDKLTRGVKKNVTFIINKAIYVDKEYCYELISDKMINYNKFDNLHKIKFVIDSDLRITNLYRNATDSCVNILYTDNIKDLKNTIYYFSNLWNIKDVLDEQKKISLNMLILYPIYYPQFEYLIKMKLYNLALYSANMFNKSKSFQQTFGVTSDFLSFMQIIDIDYEQLEALRLCKKKNLTLINLIANHRTVINRLLKFNLDLNKVHDYILNNGYSLYNIYEYADYIEFANKLDYDLTDKDVLYPDDLLEEHDRLYLQAEILSNPSIETNIESLAKKLKINTYETDKYIIFPAKNVDQLLDESRQQHNCLRTYCEKYSRDECQIYFMREKDNIDKSLVTIEVNDCKIVQAKGKFNGYPKENLMKILREWEKTIVKVEDKNNTE